VDPKVTRTDWKRTGEFSGGHSIKRKSIEWKSARFRMPNVMQLFTGGTSSSALSAIEEAYMRRDEFYNAGVPGRLKHLPTFHAWIQNYYREEKVPVCIRTAQRMWKSSKTTPVYTLFCGCSLAAQGRCSFRLNQDYVGCSLVSLTCSIVSVAVWISLIKYFKSCACCLLLDREANGPVTKCLLWYKI
jgi:hypothetical protein